jgi:hypothetical protein
VTVPTVRLLALGEAVPGQVVEYLGETRIAYQGLPPGDPLDESKVIYTGHPGRVDRDWDEPYGGHVVVTWFGIEDTDESNNSSGYGWEEATRTYPGLGWIDPSTYEKRVRRMRAGLPPVE